MNPTIRNTRKLLNLTQRQFAPLMGMNQPALSRIESGQRTETAVHRRLLTAIAVMNSHGLLQEYLDTITDTE